MPLLKWSSKYTSRKFKEDKTMHRIIKHLYFLFLLTMQKVIYTLDDKIHTVSELITAFGDPLGSTTRIVDADNYMRYFGIFINTMIEQLAFDKNQKDQKLALNDAFSIFLTNEFLPQYAEILWFNLNEYKADVQAKFVSGLSI